MNKVLPYLLSLISGALLAIAWNPFLTAFSLFFAFIPILFLVGIKNIHYTKVFNLSMLSFSCYHIGNVWWLSKSSFPGFLVIILINSFFMSLVVLLSFSTYKKFGKNMGIFSFVIYWLSFEYLHYRWEMSWPYMNLGNWLGQLPKLIQWYEYTGVLGGTAWILVVNIAFFSFIKLLITKKIKFSIFVFVISLFIFTIPILISQRVYNSYQEKGLKLKMKIIQPNINPYTEKYNKKLFNQQIYNQINTAFQNDTSQIDCYIFPESSFPVYLNESLIKEDNLIQKLDSLLIKKKASSILGGLYSYRVIDNDTLFYNTAFLLNADVQIYHKSKLVIGVEKMPFQDYLYFLKKWNLDFGGFNNSLTTDNERKVFQTKNNKLCIAPIICYESIYGEFVSDFIKQGATSIALITNDGWWGDTPALSQILMHSQLRAIETRKSVVRAANTGVSCFINQKGEIVSQAKSWEHNSLKGSVLANSELTFYTKNGDYIGKISLYSSFLILIFGVYLKIKTRLNQTRYV